MTKQIPRVLIDGCVFENRKQIGIWRVFFEVLTRSKDQIDYTLLINGEPQMPVPDGVRTLPAVHRTKLFRSHQLLKRKQRRDLLTELKQLTSNAIWHSTFFTAPPATPKARIITVYDCISETFCQINPALNSQADRQVEEVSQADIIIAISQETKSELVKLHPSISQKIHVASLGHEHLGHRTSKVLPVQSRRHCLFVGNRDSYKNFLSAVEATTSSHWPLGCQLNVVGPPFTARETAMIRYFGANDRISHQGRVTDEQLANFYGEHRCFLFPSLQEGFGLPTLEAQLSGCICILSDIPVFREVAGDGALFCNPHDSNDIARRVAECHGDGLVQRTQALGLENVRRHRWDDTAKIVSEVYQTASMLELH